MTDEENYEERLKRLFEHYAPENVSKIPSYLKKYKGDEEGMMKTFIKKYGPEVPQDAAEGKEKEKGDDAGDDAKAASKPKKGKKETAEPVETTTTPAAKPVKKKKTTAAEGEEEKTETAKGQQKERESTAPAGLKSRQSKQEKKTDPAEPTTTTTATGGTSSSSPSLKKEKKRATSAHSDHSNKKASAEAQEDAEHEGKEKEKEEDEKKIAAKSKSSKKRTGDAQTEPAVPAAEEGRKASPPSKKREKSLPPEETPAKRVKKRESAEAAEKEDEKEEGKGKVSSPAAAKGKTKQQKAEKEEEVPEATPEKPKRRTKSNEPAVEKEKEKEKEKKEKEKGAKESTTAAASHDKSAREKSSPAKREPSKKRRAESSDADGNADVAAPSRKSSQPPAATEKTTATSSSSSKKKKEPTVEEQVTPAKQTVKKKDSEKEAPVERRARSDTTFNSQKSTVPTTPQSKREEVKQPTAPSVDAVSEFDDEVMDEDDHYDDDDKDKEAVEAVEAALHEEAKTEFNDDEFEKRRSLGDVNLEFTPPRVPRIDIPAVRTPPLASVKSTGAARHDTTGKGSQMQKSVKKSETALEKGLGRKMDAAKVLMPTRGTSAEDIQLEALELTIQEVLAMHDVEKLHYAARMAQKYAPSRFSLFTTLEGKYSYEEGELTRIYLDTKQALERGSDLQAYGTRGPWTTSSQQNPVNSFGSKAPEEEVPEGKTRSAAGSHSNEVRTQKSAAVGEPKNDGEDDEKFTDALDDENQEEEGVDEDDVASVTESFWCNMTDEMGLFSTRRDALAARLADFFDIACPAKKHLAIDLATMHAGNPRELVQKLSDAYGRELAYMVFVAHDHSSMQGTNAAANGQAPNARRPPTKIIGDESAETLQAYPFLPPITSPSSHEFSPILRDDCNKALAPFSPQQSRRGASIEQPGEGRTIPLPENAQRYIRAAQELALFYGMSATYVDRVHAQVRCSPLGQRRVDSPLISSRLSTTSSRRGVLDSVRGTERPFIADDIYDDWIDDDAYEERLARTVLIEVVTAIFPEAVLCALQDDSQRVAFVSKRLAQFFSFHDPRFVDSVNDVLLQYRPADDVQHLHGTLEGSQGYAQTHMGYTSNGTAQSEHWHSHMAQQQQLLAEENDLRYAVGDVLIEYYGPLMNSIQGFSFDWDILQEPEAADNEKVQFQQNVGVGVAAAPEGNSRKEAVNLRHRHMKEAIHAWASEFGSRAAAAWGSTGSRLTAPTRSTTRPPLLTDASVDTEELSASIEAKRNAELLKRNVEVLTSKCDTGIMTDPRPNYEEFHLKEKLAEVRSSYYRGNQRTFGSKPSSSVLPAREHPSCYSLSNSSVLLETDSCPRCALIQAQLDTVRGELQRQHSEKLSVACIESQRAAERKHFDEKFIESARQRSESSRISTSSGLSSDVFNSPYSASNRSSTRESSEPALALSRGVFPYASGSSGALSSASQNHLLLSRSDPSENQNDTVQHLRQRLQESYDTARKSQMREMQAQQVAYNGGSGGGGVGGGATQRFFGPEMLNIRPNDPRSRNKQTTTSSTTMTNLTGEHIDGIRRYFLLDTL